MLLSLFAFMEGELSVVSCQSVVRRQLPGAVVSCQLSGGSCRVEEMRVQVIVPQQFAGKYNGMNTLRGMV